MINGLKVILQKASNKQIKNLFGDYKSLIFESNSNVKIPAVLNTEVKPSGFM
ncbi:hypothetical protein GCM10023314_09750 [Algibacter agarivorans]|uniref:Uncharacterized protein n=1 Tax=Algibacter agarivorans TaxID=1109741 RepID=A0ABP9GF84_9FLAO